MATGSVTRPTPIAIQLSDDDDYKRFGVDDGSDLLVVDGAMNPLPHEIEVIDRGAGDLVLWVLLDGLTQNGASLSLHYGGVRTTSVNKPGLVFADAALVWHFGANSDVAVVSDSAGGDPNPGTSAGGVINKGASVFGDGAVLGNASIETAASPGIYPEGGSLTLSFWFTSSVISGTLFQLGEVTPSVFGVSIYDQGSTVEWDFSASAGPEAPPVIPLQIGNPSVGRPVHVSVHIVPGNPARFRLRHDGVSIGTEPIYSMQPTLTGIEPLAFGRLFQDEAVMGTLDEVRVYRHDRSLPELNVERQNSANTGFVTIRGAEPGTYP